MALALLLPAPAEARPDDKNVVSSKKESKYPGGCNTKSCLHRVRRKRMLRYIRPYRSWFLGPVGACESGTGSPNLKVGLRAHNPSWLYHGRYQFDYRSWYGAGGRGDPHHAGWLEQAYRAVRWLHINGRSSWPNC